MSPQENDIFSPETEHRATDLFTLFNTLKGIDPENYKKLFEQFVGGYRDTATFYKDIEIPLYFLVFV